jgi:UDP-2,4-diacetamido-2,4,6-trideoxy-beta-L-altropyranose hydrolase
MSAAAEHLYVRVDAAARIGLGHFVRCFALGQYWRELQHPVTFVGRYPEALRAALAGEGIAAIAVGETHPDPRDLKATLGAIPAGALAVLDGYDFDLAYQEALAADRRLLVIDDVGHLPAYAGAALLNANLAAEAIHYARAPSRRLLGPAYALLRRTFRQRRGHAARRPLVGNIVVSLGGTDAGNHTLDVLRALHAVRTDAQVRAIIGPLNPHRDELAEFAARHPAVTLVESPNDMAAELCSADLAIASAGSIFFEIAVLGLPSVLLAVADNQLPGGRAAAEFEAAVFAGDARRTDLPALTELLREVLGDASRRESIALKAGKLVDGAGVERVAGVLRTLS